MTAPDQPISLERALQLRKAGATIPRLARMTQLPVNEFQGELAALLFDKHPGVDSDTALALEQLDALTAGQWPKVVAGDPSAVSQVLNVASRREVLLSKPQRRTPSQKLDSAVAELVARTRGTYGEADDEGIEQS